MEKDPIKKIVSVNVSPAVFCLFDFLTLEDGTSGLSQSINKEFLLYAASYVRRVKI